MRDLFWNVVYLSGIAIALSIAGIVGYACWSVILENARKVRR